MSLSIPQPELLAALSRAAGFQPSKLRNHIFGHVFCQADAAGLSMLATDGSTDVCCRIPAPADGKPFEPFACGVPGGSFLKLVSRLPAGPITLALDAKTGKLTIKAGRSRATLPVIDAAKRPGLEQPPADMTPIQGKALAEAVSRTAFTAGDGGEEHANLNQLRFRVFPDRVAIEALDGHAYARAILPPGSDWEAACELDFGVDAKSILSKVKWIDAATHMACTPKRLFFADALGWWSIPALHGAYPDTARFVAKVEVPGAVLVDLDTAELAAAVDRLSVVQPPEYATMKLHLDGSGCRMLSSLVGGCLGHGLEPLLAASRADGSADPLALYMPGRAFGEFCARSPHARVQLVITPDCGPVGVKPLCDNGTTLDDWLGIMMPMQVTGDDLYDMEEAA